jgi:peptidylprolyl isomerase
VSATSFATGTHFVRRLAALLIAAAFTLTACGSSDEDSSANNAASEESKAKTVSSPLPEVTGEFGVKPTIATSPQQPSKELAVKVLKAGTGKEVKADDLLVAHYLGQVWDTGTVFDNSYDRGEPAAFAIGAGRLIKGWDDGLVGQKVGSRVAMAVPPNLGYGEAGNQQAGIEADDTLVFVVDILDVYSKGVSAANKPVASLPPELPKVKDNGKGKAPTVTIADGAPAPTQTSVTVVAEGTGEPLAADKQLVAQVIQVNFTSKETEYNSWDEAPLALKASALPGLPEALTGKSAGTRVLLQVAAADSGKDPLLLVIDVVDRF